MAEGPKSRNYETKFIHMITGSLVRKKEARVMVPSGGFSPGLSPNLVLLSLRISRIFSHVAMSTTNASITRGALVIV